MKNLEVIEEKEIVAGNDDALLGLLDDGSTGLEDIKSSDLKYGFLSIAALQSKKAMATSTEHIPGLAPGLFWNTQNKFIYGNKVKVVVVSRFDSFKEMEPGANGKFVRSVPNDEFEKLVASKTIVQDKSSWIGLPNGNLIKENKNFIVLIPDHLDHGFLRFTLSAGSFKHYRSWLTQMCSLKVGTKSAPIWGFGWELLVGMEEDKQGNPYFTIGSGGSTNVKNIGKITDLMKMDEVLATIEAFKKFEEEKYSIAATHVSNEDDSTY